MRKRLTKTEEEELDKAVGEALARYYLEFEGRTVIQPLFLELAKISKVDVLKKQMMENLTKLTSVNF
jgi:hypothetical protein